MAEKISGSETNFVDKMNKKAKEIGMNDTIFVNCTGLPCVGQYSTALDVSIMFSKLLEHDAYFEFSNIWMDKIVHDEGRFTEISNTNKLIKYYDGCDSGKTGYTSEAGHCLCASAKKDNLRLISVVIKAPDSKRRFFEVSNMFNYGFSTFSSKVVIDNNTPLDYTANVKGGKEENLQIIPKISLVINKGAIN